MLLLHFFNNKSFDYIFHVKKNLESYQIMRVNPSIFSAEKNGKTRHKVALFSAEKINYCHSALHGPAACIQR